MALRPRDSQKQKVYDWDAHFRKDRLTLVQCQTLVNRACAAHNVRPPKVQASYGSTAYYKPMLNTITLPPWAQNSATVLHEVSHAVIDKKFSRFPVKTEDAASFGEPLKLYQPPASHGPEFARVLLELLAYFGVAKVNEARKAAREHRVKISSDSKFKPGLKKTQVSQVSKLKAQKADLQAQIAEIDAKIAVLTS